MKSFKKSICLFLIAVLTLVICACGDDKDNSKSKTNDDKNLKKGATEEAGKVEDPCPDKDTVIIDVKDYGKMTVKLNKDTAPITVANFKKLVKDGKYDGLTFHRIISGFMIQGGDPNGDGTGGMGENIKGEFSSNGVTNNLSHKRGVISMARSADPNSASSQFFIMHADNPSLDGQYAAFGEVTDGIEVVDKICKKVKPTDDNGTVEKKDQPTITSIKFAD